MSGPYVYTPSAFEPTPYLGYGAYAQRSPFIPPVALYPSSPFPPSSPYLRPTTPQGVLFDDSYWNPAPRARRPSWHGGLPPSPFLSTPSTPWHARRRSHGGGFAPWEPASPWASPGLGPSSSPHHHIQIHPRLNGEAPPPTADLTHLYFDLASPHFAPLVYVVVGGPLAQIGQAAAQMSPDELHEPATYPPVTRMRVSHGAIPQWPIDLEFRYDGYAAPAASPPITLGDVLWMIHSSLHRQITHQDWAKLSVSEETAIARAYTRRCKNAPSSAQEEEASRGVKRIDYLLEKHIFRGLVRAHDEDGVYHWKLITA